MSAITITEAARLSGRPAREAEHHRHRNSHLHHPARHALRGNRIAYCKPGEEKPDDIALALKSFTAWIDGTSEPFLEDALVDYATDRMGGQLTIKAPNAKVPMVNEDSPMNERINYYLQTEINPGLASHGGQVTLIDVVEEGIAVLQFGGGCQGCGQADVTLKEGIEKTLLARIPELKGVRDVTDHTNRENAY